MSALKGSFAVAWGLAFIAVVNFALAKSGVIQLDVDATRLAEGVLSVQESIPAEPGRVRIAYPKWIPGEHSPSGPVSDVVNFHVLGNGQPLPWARDLEDLFSVWIDVPPGCDSLELRFDYLMNAGGALSARPSASPRTAYLNWYWVFWYERSADLDQTLVEAQLRLPTEWQLGSALDAQRVDERVRFEKVSVRSLFEHPVLLGQHLATYNLAPEDSVPHALHVASDTHEANALKDEQLKAYRRLVKELDALFGTRHYKRYHFLVAISSVLGSNGLEHHECSENRVLEETFLDDTVFSYMGSLLPHEYFHSWNGKFRRPQAMLSPDYQQIMQGDLLWVYEGLTEFYGNVLAARAGIISADFYREQLAASAAYYERQSGRGWRPLVDTGTAIQFGYMSPRAGSNQRRGADVYSESELLWLEAHALLQTASSGKRGIDDFARRFIDGAEQAPAGAPQTLGVSISPYKESDVIGALQAIAPADWTSFIAKRVHQTGATPPASVLRALGWELVYTGEENAALAAGEKVSSSTGFDATLGFSLSSEAKVEDLDPASPAGKAGLPIGSTVIGVNGRKFSLEGLKAAVRDSEKTGAVELLVESGSFLKTYRLIYSGGPKNPHLKRVEGTPDLLTPLISPLSLTAAPPSDRQAETRRSAAGRPG